MNSSADKDLRRLLHGTIKRVTEDIELRFNFNTAISAIMELVNGLYHYRSEVEKQNAQLLQETIEKLLILLAPFTPHLSAELWEAVGLKDSVHSQDWPAYDEAALKTEEVEIVIQINGKVRDRLVIPVELGREELEKQALSTEKVQAAISGKEVRKVITVPGKLVNIVVK